MNISAWAIRRPTLVILFFIILIALGLLSFHKLGIDDNPNVDYPLIMINIIQPGASPKELETDITKKVEDSLLPISGIDHITSIISDGLSMTAIEFKIGWPSDLALNDVRDAVSKIRQSLPQDINEPSITHPNFSGEPFIVYSIESNRKTVEELTYFVDNTVARGLLTVSGVSQVVRSGGLDREIRVELNPERMRAIGVTPDLVNTQIKALNINLPGGIASVGGQEQTIRAIGSVIDVEHFKNLQIVLPSGQFTRLDTLGKITDATAEVRQIARFNGKQTVAFSVLRSQGASLVSVEEEVKKKVEEMKREFPPDIKIEMIRTSAKFIKDRFTASIDALMFGALLAIIIIYIFLKNWQATLIGAMAIPLSILGTFIIMDWLGYTLNFITMLGLILVVGILVDDAIVDLENIHRHIAMGKRPFTAAIEATNEIGLAIIATTFTIVAVFVPVAFMGGVAGQFFKSFGITVSVAVLFSLLIARTLTPMMAAYLLPPHKSEEPAGESRMQKLYKSILIIALNHRFLTTLGAVLIFAGSLMLVPLLPKTFLPQGDISEASISVELPSGSMIDDTEKTVGEVTNILKKRPEVKFVFSSIGSGVQVGLIAKGGSVNTGTINIVLVPPNQRKLSLDDFETDVLPQLSEIPGARISFNHFGIAGVGSKPLNVILRGNDSILLEHTASELLKQMRSLNELRNVTTSSSELRPEIIIKPDFQRAADQGVSVFAIARIARIATQGDIDVNLPKFNAGERQINIRVKLDESVKYDIQAIGDLLVPGKIGLVPIKSVADISVSSGPVQIKRYDRTRQVTVSANLNDVALGTGVALVDQLPVMKNLPPGISKSALGESKIMNDVFGDFSKAITYGVLFIYVVLVLLFGGFLHPLTIMVALPLSIGGALLALLSSHKPLGLMSLIGIIMLLGIVTKNSILLVEYAVMSERNGITRREAIINAGLARLRPIIMTTIAMISGMIPIAFSIGTGTEPQSPMATAVIGGLITSTIFTLIVIPAIYTYVDDVRLFLTRVIKLKKIEDYEKESISDQIII